MLLVGFTLTVLIAFGLVYTMLLNTFKLGVLVLLDVFALTVFSAFV